MTARKTATKKTADRPSAVQSRAARPEDRVPVGGVRDILTVVGQRDDLSYRWVKDTHEDGPRIFNFNRGGWDFVQAKDVKVGKFSVYTTENVGSIVRHPDGAGEYLFLMCIPKELYDEDQARKLELINLAEQELMRPKEDDGQYGESKISFKFGRIGEDDNLKG